MMNEESYDELRRFQRIPSQRPKKAVDRAEQALNQAKCMHIPQSVVREARALYNIEERAQEAAGPFSAVRQFVTNLLR